MGLRVSLPLPFILTVIRLIASPLILPVCIVYAQIYNSLLLHIMSLVLFVFLAMTDFLDGYLARTMNQETMVGKILDPLADKFLLYATLIALLVVNRIAYYWVIFFIGREFFVMGLRLLASENDMRISVSKLAKMKTVLQFLYLTILLVQPLIVPNALLVGIENSCLISAVVCSCVSAFMYYKNFMGQIYARKYEGYFT